MIHLLGTIPHKVNIAFSGGVDSLACAHFLQRGGRDITLLHFNHGNTYSDDMQQKCVQLAKKMGIPIICETITECYPPNGLSYETLWRIERYKFLRKFISDPVITCHHLNDAVETWVWSSLHGQSKLIPRENNGVIRPFLLVPKTELETYAKLHKLNHVEDPSNDSYKHMRNYIRGMMMPHVLHVNPGIEKVIRKKYLDKKDEIPSVITSDV